MKLLFTTLAAFLLLFSISSFPLTISSNQTIINFNTPEEVGPESNLYKYFQHVPVTEFGWWQSTYDASGTSFNPYSSAPNTNHILWIGKVRPYEGLRDRPLIVAGKVLVQIRSSQSIYTGNIKYAFHIPVSFVFLYLTCLENVYYLK